MSEWKQDIIGNIATTFAGGTPSRSNLDFYNNGNIPWLSSSEVNQDYITNAKEMITSLGLENSSAKWIPKNSVLIALYGATAGQVAQLRIAATANQAVLALVPNKDIINVDFLFYQVKWNKGAILFMAQGSGQPNLSKKLIDSFKIKFPSPSEQQRIASILSTCDAVIEKTVAAIAKYKAIKQGLLQDLFTRGIDPTNNRLRPRYEDAPELYKESELGWIPKEWEEDVLEKCCERIAVGIATSSSGYFAQYGVLFLRNQNIKENRIDLTDTIYITKEFAEINSPKYLKGGDVITVRTGYPGISAVVPEELEGSQTFTTLITTPNSKQLNSHYLSYFINSSFGRKQILGLQGGGAQQNLNSGALETMHIDKPTLEEQKLIVSRMKTVEQSLQTEQTYLQKLQQIKKGLMEDLLTGKKKVKIDEPAMPNKNEHALLRTGTV